jgi:hypothetical protein
MDPGVLETTRKHGYKSAAPSGHTPPGNVDLHPAPKGSVTLGGGGPLFQKYQAAAEHLKAKGMNDAQIRAAIGAPPEEE